MNNLTELFCFIDDFCNQFIPIWGKKLLGSSRGPSCSLSISEIITILILFHNSNFRNFKYFYLYLEKFYSKEFPKLLSYSRFVRIKKKVFVPLFAYLLSRQGKITGIAFIDATSIAVCKNKRISRNKVFKGLAKRGKTTTGWFYGFKLHLIVNDRGEILSFLLTPGNISDIAPVELLSKDIFGNLYGDKGYISNPLFNKLYEKGLKLFTTLRSNMKNKFISVMDKMLLRKRSIIETINDQLKNISQIEHSRHRSIINFSVNILAGLVAYSHQNKKPSIKFENELTVAC
ncbi:hypothetical protein LCGC14_1635650 [marine sediment metagenome]|uniref:Transposase DDE domain-containing protein n=1 Tax=marine sediment metagenome TaxID=412755 RepID=A0A0F9I1A5_9ZZZZ